MMSEVFFVVTVLTTNCESFPKSHKSLPNRNQRIIKVQGPPHFNHFYGHKPVRTRPFGKHHKEEFIRPNHLPPIPPFFSGASTNHIKHLPRPPPHVFHKLPSYGLGFPYKTVNSLRATLHKDHVRVPSLTAIRSVTPTATVTGASHGASPSISLAAYHSPPFTASTYIASPVGPIISSDDNNGPIHEIPAPNLAPKPHDASFGSFGHLETNSFSSFGKDASLVSSGLTLKPYEGAFSTAGHIGSDLNFNSFNTFNKEPNVLDVNSLIKDSGVDVSAYLKESDGDSSYGKETKVEIANFDEGSSIDVTNLIKDATVSDEQNSGYEVTEPHNHHSAHTHHSSEEHNLSTDHDSEEHVPSNDLVIKGVDGTKLYYAPDPDPSLPVHKVPPTSDPHSTPSNGQMKNVFISQISQGFPYLQGGAIGTPVTSLSSQELFQLMHGYSTVPVIPQPVVSFVGEPQFAGVTLSSGGLNYYQQGLGGSVGHYTQPPQYSGNDVGQYLQQPDIHNLLHGSESQHEQQTVETSQNSIVSNDNQQHQSAYSPQNQYQGYIQSQYQTSLKDSSSGSDSSDENNYGTAEINHNYQYEPEASETRDSLTVIKHANDGILSSETVKELLLEDSASNELNYQETENERETTSETIPTILQLKNIPEVPFYASLPNKKAAEALASLQAAGSVASNYINRIKNTRGDQGPEPDYEETQGRKGKTEKVQNFEVSQIVRPHSYEAKEQGRILKGETIKLGSEKTVVEIQQSVPLYEVNVSAKSLTDNGDSSKGISEFSPKSQAQDFNENLEFKEDGSNETFGRRIRPK